jgi:hypothetical protein
MRMADKALLLGINNYKKVNPLRGCVNDVENMRRLLADVFGFSTANVKTLLNEKVVKSEIKKQMKWLFKDAGPDDRLVLHFSGHGSYTADLDGDEDDGADELICLYDMDFGDPDTYFLDDELHDWTGTLPRGAHLTIVLDSCHSGTGTRLMLAPAAGKPQQQVAVRVDHKATLERALTGAAPGARGLEMAAAAASALDPAGDAVVRVRFVDPPPAIKAEVERRKKKPTRGLVVARMNHVLLAACRPDQTAADATIDGVPNGAFTYYLCQTIRNGGEGLDRQELIGRLERSLRDNRFDQVPQFEGPAQSGPVFPPRTGTPASVAAPPTSSSPVSPAPAASLPPETTAAADSQLAPLLHALPEIARLASEAQLQIIRLLHPTTGAALPLRGAAAPAGARCLVYVHGICRHVAGYSDGWWQALHPFTTAFGPGTLGESRREVLWSDIVNARALAVQPARAIDAPSAARAAAHARLKQEICEVLQDRIDRAALAAVTSSAPGAAARALADPRGVISIPFVSCLDDFTVYLTNDAVRAQVIGRFTGVVRPLLEQGAEVDVISHSWGTVVAYEGLRELEDAGLTQPRLRNLFTAGAALSIGPVKSALRPANHDGRRPAMVRRWVNLDAQGDVVGGPLQGRPYAVDNDFPNLDPFGCPAFLGIVNPVCAHGSYFVAGNDAVNRDIFGNFIAQA